MLFGGSPPPPLGLLEPLLEVTVDEAPRERNEESPPSAPRETWRGGGVVPGLYQYAPRSRPTGRATSLTIVLTITPLRILLVVVPLSDLRRR
jgi:hypothetical protein